MHKGDIVTINEEGISHDTKWRIAYFCHDDYEPDTELAFLYALNSKDGVTTVEVSKLAPADVPVRDLTEEELNEIITELKANNVQRAYEILSRLHDSLFGYE